MGKFDYYCHATQLENYECLIYHIKPNSKFEYEETPVRFRCSPANSRDVKSYRITKGVLGDKDSVFLIATNLPENIEPNDRVVFMGKILNVESVGFYLQDNGIVDASIMSIEYLEARSPKGLTLK
jgi:hypothetical protein